MSIFKKTIALSAAIGIVASLAFAGGHSASPEDRAVKARQAKMTLYSFNLGVLGAMAKGEVAYNADAAGLAAANLAALTSVWMPGAWIEGTDNESVKGTDALPALWQNLEDVGKKGMELGAAAQKFAAVAGTDLESLRGGIGSVGDACGACHKLYRKKQN